MAIIDVGLPDGNGSDLIRELATSNQRPDVILGLSGDVDSEAIVMEAGADGYLGKPIVSLAEFQDNILSNLPYERHPTGPRAVPKEIVEPDPIAYRDDMAHVADVMESASDTRTLDYIAQFLGGVARSADDRELVRATELLAAKRARGDSAASEAATVAGLVQRRLTQKVAI